MRGSFILALFALAGLARPAAAATFVLNYTGFAEYTPVHTPYDVVYNETGSGFLDLDTSLSEVTLSSGLNSFSFTTSIIETISGPNFPPYVFPAGTVTYGLDDLAYFDAIITDGIITYFEFETNTKNQSYGDGSDVSFYAFGDDGGSYIGGETPSTSGVITVTPAATADVPEEASWVLMVSGFGLVGAMLRTRQRMEARLV